MSFITDWKINTSSTTYYRQYLNSDKEMATICSIYDCSEYPYIKQETGWYCEIFGLNGSLITFFDNDLHMAKLEADIKLFKMGFSVDITDHIADTNIEYKKTDNFAR